jgi:dihydroorotate dehydrogenase (fumarate)
MRNATKVLYKGVVKPLIFKMKPDTVHDGMIRFGSFAGKVPPLMWLLRSACKYENPALEVEAMGMHLKNPIGLGAGMDKNAEIAACLHSAGFGLATFGSMTAYECAGNARPWFHRFIEYKSMLIHVGLANKGTPANKQRVEDARDKFQQNMKVGASLALTNDAEKSSNHQKAVEDYVKSFKTIVNSASFIEINISCPNTCIGEPFSSPERLEQLLVELDKIERKIPVTLKMPSDRTWEEFKELLIVADKHNVQGITITNLRKDRTGLDNIPPDVLGNISGAPTFEKSLEFTRLAYKEFGKRFTIIGLGGVFSAEQAYKKIKAGASIVEFVSALMFEGPQVAADIKVGLVELLRADGFKNVSEAVGVDVK